MSADFPATGGRPDVRAADADRDQVLDLLRTAVADGRLTSDEFGERVEAALTARTMGELAVLTADLSTPAVAAARAEDVVRLDQRSGSVQRTGRWVVPRRLEVRSSWGDETLLDFTEAIIVADSLLVDVNIRGGTLVLVTRPGVVVDADSLTVRYTDVNIRSGGELDTPVMLRVQLSGRIRYGHIEIRA